MAKPETSRLLLMLLLATVLVLGPVLPALAFIAPTDDGSAYLHASHATHANEVLSAQQADMAQSPCGQHDSCHDQCCTTCAHCLAGTFLIAAVYGHARAVKSPSVQPWRPQLSLSAPHRPPQVI